MSSAQLPSHSAAACGIDFGTSNSTVGWVRPMPGNPQPSWLLPIEDEKTTLPSVIFFHAESADISYGRAALADYLAGDEGRLMRSLKSLLGTSMLDEHTEVMGQAVSFQSLLVQFIQTLKERAELAAGRSFTQAVLGRPVFFVDDDAQADQRAQNSLEDIAHQCGLRDVAFQYEPIAAAFDYESRLQGEELVLVADVGGGTSDFTLIRLSPERALASDRKADILASGGVHIGGTDLDRALSLAAVMPLLGLGETLANGRMMPSATYFNLATWHTINRAYTRQTWTQLLDLQRQAANTQGIDRLMHLVQTRAGHWLAMQVEASKIALTDAAHTTLDLHRIADNWQVTLQRDVFEHAIDGLLSRVRTTVSELFRTAGVKPADINTLFFTGGSSSVPALRQQLLALAPQAGIAHGDLFGSIGSGLALDSARRFR